MWWFTPKISWTTTTAPRGTPAGSARYTEKRLPSADVSWGEGAMGSGGLYAAIGRVSASRTSAKFCHGLPVARCIPMVQGWLEIR